MHLGNIFFSKIAFLTQVRYRTVEVIQFLGNILFLNIVFLTQVIYRTVEVFQFGEHSLFRDSILNPGKIQNC